MGNKSNVYMVMWCIQSCNFSDCEYVKVGGVKSLLRDSYIVFLMFYHVADNCCQRVFS